MAKENIARFIDAAMTDKALAAKVAALATEHGYDFTAEELLEFGVAHPLSNDMGKGAVPKEVVKYNFDGSFPPPQSSFDGEISENDYGIFEYRNGKLVRV